MGKLTEQEVTELHDCFVTFDTDNKGSINVDVLRNVLRCLGFNHDDEVGELKRKGIIKL